MLSGGIQLVSGTTAVDLQATGSAASGDLAVETTNGNVVPAGGQIGAILTGVNTTIPSYQSQLSAVADSLAQNLNTLQAGGVSANGTPGPTPRRPRRRTPARCSPRSSSMTASATTYTTGRDLGLVDRGQSHASRHPFAHRDRRGHSPAGVSTIDPTTAQAMAAVGQSTRTGRPAYQSLVGLVGSQTADANNDQTAAQALSDSTTAAAVERRGGRHQPGDRRTCSPRSRTTRRSPRSSTARPQRFNALLAAV